MDANNTTAQTIMSLDVGGRRIGVAIANRYARLAQPLTTLIRNDETFSAVDKLAKDNNVDTIVVGLPRSLEGNITRQTQETLKFIEQLEQEIGLPVRQQDEALTSKKAENELIARAKPYTKSDIDALAATYILEDYLTQQEVMSG